MKSKAAAETDRTAAGCPRYDQRLVRWLAVRLLRRLPKVEVDSAITETILERAGFRKSVIFPGCWRVTLNCSERYGIEANTHLQENDLLEEIGINLSANAKVMREDNE